MLISGLIILVVFCLLLTKSWRRQFLDLQLLSTKHPFVLSAITGLISFIFDQIWNLLTLRPRGAVLPPSFPGKLPILGNIYMLSGKSIHTWKTLERFSHHSLEHGGVGLVHFGPHNFFVLTDPEDALALANRHLEKTYIYDFAKPWLANGLVTANATIWKPHRKLIAPAFNSIAISTLIPVINGGARKLADRMSLKVGKGHFDPSDLVVHSVLEITGLTTFGLQRDENNLIDDYCHKAEYLLDSFGKRYKQFWLHIPFIYNLSSLKRTIDGTAKILKNMVIDIICKRKSSRSVTSKSTDVLQKENFTTLLDFMLDTNEQLNVYTDEEIRAHLDTMTVATMDTTSCGLVFIFAIIGSYQEVQEKIYKELKEIFQDSTRDVDRHDLTKLVYLDAVVKESLRLYPPVPFILRSSDEEVKLKNYTLPPHGTYAMSIYGINRHSMWGPDADQFRPERWLEPGGLPDNPNAFASFSLGKRNCLGKLYSAVFIKIALVHVLRRYRLNSDISKMVLKWDIMLKPDSGHEITLEEKVSLQ